MVQMPVHSNRDLKSIMGGGIWQQISYGTLNLDFSEEKKFDEDLAKCFLRWTLIQGGVLKVRKEKYNIIAQIDQQIIKGYIHNAFIEKLISPLIKELEDKV